MKKIFIVDDDKMYLMIITRRIAKINADVVIESYRNGMTAVEELKKLASENQDLPDTILLDINMPVMDGWQFLDEVERELPEILHKVKIYMVSTSIEATDKQKAMSNEHVLEYISKPISPEKLEEILGVK